MEQHHCKPGKRSVGPELVVYQDAALAQDNRLPIVRDVDQLAVDHHHQLAVPLVGSVNVAGCFATLHHHQRPDLTDLAVAAQHGVGVAALAPFTRMLLPAEERRGVSLHNVLPAVESTDSNQNRKRRNGHQNLVSTRIVLK